MAYFVQFFTLSMNLHSNRVQLLPPTHKLTKIVKKPSKMTYFCKPSNSELESILNKPLLSVPRVTFSAYLQIVIFLRSSGGSEKFPGKVEGRKNEKFE